MNLSRLKLACRRGMLELDLVLVPFADEFYPDAPPKIQLEFDALLECSDQDLFDWLMGKKDADLKHQKIVKQVRDYAQKRHQA